MVWSYKHGILPCLDIQCNMVLRRAVHTIDWASRFFFFPIWDFCFNFFELSKIGILSVICSAIILDTLVTLHTSNIIICYIFSHVWSTTSVFLCFSENLVFVLRHSLRFSFYFLFYNLVFRFEIFIQKNILGLFSIK